MIERSNISEVRKNIEGLVGQKVLLRGSLGRNKTFEREAIVENVYPNQFLIKRDDTSSKECYSYVDLLSNRISVEIQGLNGDYSSILNNNTPEIKF